MAEQPMSNEERLYRAFEEHVDPETFDFSERCLVRQTAHALGCKDHYPVTYLTEAFNAPYYRVWDLFVAYKALSCEHWLNLPYCLAIAREILGLPPLTDKAEPAEIKQEVTA